MRVDVDRWTPDAKARFFEVLGTGDTQTLRRLTTGIERVDSDRGEQIRATFTVTLPELFMPEAEPDDKSEGRWS